MAEKENVLTVTYDLLVYIVPLLSKFPRTQKYVLADRIQNLLTDILQTLITAYYGRGEAKKASLQQANLQLEQMRYLIRLAKDLRCLDLRRYELIQSKINDIGAQVGGWLKSMS
ncbi:MAG: diversity-generating retroelement protein Avd [Saprospiraceae bacterium]|jgi:hypothetical protein